MSLEEFEQLLSEWLDEPQRADLVERMEAAVAESPALSHERQKWLSIDRAVRAALPSPVGIRHEEFAGRVSTALDAELDEAHEGNEIAAMLAATATLQSRVDWDRFRERVSGEIGSAVLPRRIIRFSWRRAGAVAALAAAAVVAAFLTFPPANTPAPGGPGLAFVRVPTEQSGDIEPADEEPFARVTISAPDEPIELAAASVATPPEIHLRIDPPRRSRMNAN
jgi:hypothetical protein